QIDKVVIYRNTVCRVLPDDGQNFFGMEYEIFYLLVYRLRGCHLITSVLRGLMPHVKIIARHLK
ncbi:MAG: hypothetical protein R6V15_04300, partial [Desulfotignum sp.]